MKKQNKICLILLRDSHQMPQMEVENLNFQQFLIRLNKVKMINMMEVSWEETRLIDQTARLKKLMETLKLLLKIDLSPHLW